MPVVTHASITQAAHVSASAGVGSSGVWSGGALWTPDLLGASLVAWWDASDLTTFTFNSGNVAAWASKVGALTVSQGTSGNQPGYSATARNSLPGVTFNGSNQFLDLASVAGLPQTNTASTLVVVGYCGTASDAVAIAYGTPANDRGRFLSASVKVKTGCVNDDLTSAAYNWQSNDRIAVATFPAGASPTISLYTDGNAAETKVVATQNTGNTRIRVGAYIATSASVYWNGAIQEIYVIDRVPTSDELTKIVGCAAWKWGLPANLPSNHPYRYIAPAA